MREVQTADWSYVVESSHGHGPASDVRRTPAGRVAFGGVGQLRYDDDDPSAILLSCLQTLN